MREDFLTEVENRKATSTETSAEVKPPRKFKVILHNDDYTPMEFVVDVLKHFFHLNEEISVQIMLQVHCHGRGICGVFTRDIAETKVVLVNDFSKIHQHPLLCSIEPE